MPACGNARRAALFLTTLANPAVVAKILIFATKSVRRNLQGNLYRKTQSQNLKTCDQFRDISDILFEAIPDLRVDASNVCFSR